MTFKRPILTIRILFILYIFVVFFFFHYDSPIRFLFIDSLLGYIPIELFFWLKKTKNKALVITLGFFYLLFLPNNAYLLTDLIHLSRITFYTQAGAIMTENSMAWLMFSLVILGIACLVYLGFQTETALLDEISWEKSLTKKQFLILKLLVFVVVSIGVFLGRFVRFNSISLFTEPTKVLQSFTALFSVQSFVFILLFSFVQWVLSILATMKSPLVQKK